MEIKIIIEIEEESKSVIREFSEALIGLGDSSVGGAVRTAVQKGAELNLGGGEKTPEMRNRQTNDVKEPEPKAEEAEKKDEEMPEESTKSEKVEATGEKEGTAPAAAVPGLTLEQLRAGCAEMSRLGKGAELRRLIREVYSVPKLDDLDPEHYESFADNLRELGVRI